MGGLKSVFFKNRSDAYELTEKVDSFSLSSAQLDVGYLTKGGTEKSKGINLVFPFQTPAKFGPRGTYSYILNDRDAASFHAFLEQVLAGQLPAKHQFTDDVSRRWFSSGDCCWKITKFVDNWHDGGGYKGWFDNAYGYTITRSAMSDLRDCIRDFFELAA